MRAVIRPFCGCTTPGNRKDLWCDCNTKHNSNKQPGHKPKFSSCQLLHVVFVKVRRGKKNHIFIVITTVFLTPATKQWHRPPKHHCYRTTNQTKNCFSLAHHHTQNASSDCIKFHEQFCRRIILSSCSCLVIIFVHLLQGIFPSPKAQYILPCAGGMQGSCLANQPIDHNEKWQNANSSCTETSQGFTAEYLFK